MPNDSLGSLKSSFSFLCVSNRLISSWPQNSNKNSITDTSFCKILMHTFRPDPQCFSTTQITIWFLCWVHVSGDLQPCEAVIGLLTKEFLMLRDGANNGGMP